MSIKKKTSAKKFLEQLVGPITFGMILESYMLREEISQVDLAERLRVSKGYLNNIINGRKRVSAEKASEIAAILGESQKTYIEVAIQDSLIGVGVECEVELKNFKISA